MTHKQNFEEELETVQPMQISSDIAAIG